jgi:hypothetical protein
VGTSRKREDSPFKNESTTSPLSARRGIPVMPCVCGKTPVPRVVWTDGVTEGDDPTWAFV